ncbi:hypothetical protein KFE25_000510 [Diacronema lutheri]|uniref:Uncharacterized protein n=1 Tax=Diacronema lutheri TaxID=2081491 RepID=A0A8J5XVC6_DIALT|nr:hypothetical protein KFE25_000510 [Diacronema lutheri]
MAESMVVLAQKLQGLCPLAAPDVLPVPSTSAAALSALLGRGAADADALRRLIDAAVVAHEAERGEPAGLVLRWRVDAEHLCFVLEGCRVAPKRIAELLDTRAAIVNFASRGANVASADAAAAALARANGARLGGAVDERVWMQECYAVAYAMKVVANNLGPWTYDAAPAEPARGADAPNADRVRAMLAAGGREGEAAGAPRRAATAKKRSRAQPDHATAATGATPSPREMRKGARHVTAAAP